ncbi:hypothetical protein PV10_07440 [Exophiala mesophila]|uniref:FAD/NAD(P)-binding domain-containing protein n=1 Tax=Exophiala mesophila TaxID=212818 RepID=A0A0D1Z7Y3_EXOME|nr:uncharacterized protein PV10_07440 [Exophiala mesophila]KIV90099.1 hypothetical protein PV10_07440 [Exophiala mesophila]
MAEKVVVFGGGPVGLMALKNLREDGFDAILLERRPYVGGLWKQSSDSTISVTEHTMFNTSRFRAGISDFPLPPDTPDYPSAKDLHQYFDRYCDHFELWPHIKLEAEVVGLYRERGRWAVEVQYTEEKKVEYFDKVLCATGSMVIPKQPKLEGVEKFEGSVIHAVDFPQPAELESRYGGQNVLLIGLSATAQDVITDLSGYAKKIYVTHRAGVLLTPRYLDNGSTSDQTQSLSFLFVQIFLSTYFPTIFNMIANSVLLKMHKKNFPDIPDSWNFLPAPSIASSPPLIADAFYRHVQSGFAEAVPEHIRVTGPKSIELKGGRVLNDIDSIVFCTGYDFAVPCMPAEYNPYSKVGETPYLYRNMFPLHEDPAVRNSLAFLGQAATAVPGFAQFELGGMAVSQVWKGNFTLPPFEEMKDWHRRQQAWRQDIISKQAIRSRFHVAFMPPVHLQWLDKAAGTGVFERFGWFKWRAWQLWWKDRELYKLCLSGVLTPAIWRLFDTGKRKAWSGARAQVVDDNLLAKKRREEKVKADNLLRAKPKAD